jgi:hypothetical protein
MAVAPTFPSRDALPRFRFGPLDAVVGAGVFLLLYVIVRVGVSAHVPFNPSQATTIDTSPSRLPYYAARSLLRMFIAYAFSLGYALLRVVCHERLATLTASPSCWHAGPVGVSAVLTLPPGCSPSRLQWAHSTTPASFTDSDGGAGTPCARSAYERQPWRPASPRRRARTRVLCGMQLSATGHYRWLSGSVRHGPAGRWTLWRWCLIESGVLAGDPVGCL